MMRTRMKSRAFALSLCLVLVSSSVALGQQPDPVLRAMKDELARSMKDLKIEGVERPYFLAYRVEDVDEKVVSAGFGALQDSRATRRRSFGVEMRVGDYQFDNTNFMSVGAFGMGSPFAGSGTAPLDDDYNQIRRELWLATDARYKQIAESLATKRAVLQNRKQHEELPDFSKETPTQSFEAPVTLQADLAAMEALTRELSAVFRKSPNIQDCAVSYEVRTVYTRYTNSEGTTFTRALPVVHLLVRAAAQSEDGTPLQDFAEWFGKSLSDLPAKSVMLEHAKTMAAGLEQLRTAAFPERYNGPVLFEGEAGAELFAQLFAPSLSAMRMPMTDNPQFEQAMQQLIDRMGINLQDRMGARVMPDFMQVDDKPRATEIDGVKTPMHIAIDDDGVPTRDLRLVENGILKTLLADRTPTTVSSQSTGSRRGWGPAAGNLVVIADKGAPKEQLRADLLKRAKSRGKDYAIVVRRVGNGGLNALEQMAAQARSQAGPASAMLEVYKLQADGKEVLLRGAEITGLTANSFKEVAAAGDRRTVIHRIFLPRTTGLLGASSGITAMGAPIVTLSVPSLLFEELTLKKNTTSVPNPPESAPPGFE